MKKKIEPLEHIHQLHKEAVEALRATAESMGITYGAVKQRFVFEQDLEVTEKFWEFFTQKMTLKLLALITAIPAKNFTFTFYLNCCAFLRSLARSQSLPHSRRHAL